MSVRKADLVWGWGIVILFFAAAPFMSELVFQLLLPVAIGLGYLLLGGKQAPTLSEMVQGRPEYWRRVGVPFYMCSSAVIIYCAFF